MGQGPGKKHYKVIISDCHLSAGPLFEGRLNPHEDFHADEQMAAFIQYFSQGIYGEDAQGPVSVELVLGGDYFDFLNVPYKGEFEDVVTEEIALFKLEACIAGHPIVMEALRRFAQKPGKQITYLIGNHDTDLFFEKVRDRITREWAPDREYPSPKVKVIGDTDRLIFEGNVEFHHGNQFEVGSQLDFAKPFQRNHQNQAVLNIPWSSYYVLKIVNRLKWDREFIDKVRPVKAFVMLGLVMDPAFTLKYMFLTVFYFLKTRFAQKPKDGSRLREILGMLRQETRFFLDLEAEAREYLNHNSHLKTLIFGHTHRPMNKIYPDGKQYINTGTWVRMVNLDWRGLGSQMQRTFALIEIENGVAHCDLRQWVGEYSPHQKF